MNYQQTISHLFQQLPMYQRQGKAAFKKDLTNIRYLADWLGEPQQQFPSIHIAGTNGKGSTANFLAAILQAHGYRVGLYTSPHYVDFRERIRINGALMPEAEVVDFVARLREANLPIEPSFFEITVAMAFWYFAKAKVDIAVIETGLGGRLDSTNIITPVLSVITNIGMDHEAMLGDTLAKIAAEKAGIIKAGVPVIIGQTHPETQPVFLAKAKAEAAPIQFADADFGVQSVAQDERGIYYDLAGDTKNASKVYVPSKAQYQRDNLRTVWAAYLALLASSDWSAPDLNQEAFLRGIRHVHQLTGYQGRWQHLGENPTIIADSGHNPHGLAQSMATLAEQQQGDLHFVLGMVNDKDSGKILSHLPKEATYYFCRPNIPRGLDAATLQERAQDYGLAGEVYDTVGDALAAAKKTAQETDTIFIGGSTFVVAEVL